MEKLANYSIVELIARNNRTLVYKALDNAQSPVILKVLREDVIDADKIASFKHEYDLTSKIKSEYAISVKNLVKVNNTYLIEMEDIGATSLKQYIANNFPVNNREKFIIALEIAIQITKAISGIHSQNLIHKDINPSNMVYNPINHTLKIIDFGLATELSYEDFDNTGISHFEGTFAYISPEQTGRINRGVDYRTDFYSLGITLYELFAGHLPFQAQHAREWIHNHIAKQAIPLASFNANIPKPVSDIVSKLMQKSAEYRYQSTFGILKDLEFCLEKIKSTGEIQNFIIGANDISQRFQISKKLYGREKEIALLKNACLFSKNKQPSCVFVTGSSGIGKTTLVGEINHCLIEQDGIFISGTFDPLKSNIPYYAFVKAFEHLLDQIVTENKEEIAKWRTRFLKKLDTNAGVIAEVFPMIEHIIGKQEKVKVLPTAESYNRFSISFQNFVQAFLEEDKPLVLFFDDLQWADSSSLEMIENLLTKISLRKMLFIGAYREDEVSKSHLLNYTISNLKTANTNVTTLKLGPLRQNHIQTLIYDSFNCDEKGSLQLAGYCLRKTSGNPYFINVFLTRLYEQSYLHFDANAGSWFFDFQAIEKSEVTENVAEMISRKIQSLRQELQELLKMASCIGSRFSPGLLSTLSNKPWNEIILLLKELSKQSLIMPLAEQYKIAEYVDNIPITYKFVHDKVKQSVYDLIDEQEKAQIHYSIGKTLQQLQDGGSNEKDSLFTVLEHLNKGIPAISDENKNDLANLNLKACIKAKNSGAFQPANNFAKTGITVLCKHSWEKNYNSSLQLYIEAAETSFLCGNTEEMNQLIRKALGYARTRLEKAKCHMVKILGYISQHNQPLAVKEALVLLKTFGITFPKKPNLVHILTGLAKTNRLLKKHPESVVLSLPIMTDEEKLMCMLVMSKILSATYYVDPNLFPLICYQLIKLTLKYGIAPQSPVGFVSYGLLVNILGNIDKGYELGKQGMKLFDVINAPEHKAPAATIYYAGVFVWKNEIQKGAEGLFNAYHSGLESGDLEFAVAAAAAGFNYSFHMGKELGQLLANTEKRKFSLLNFRQEVPMSQFDVLLQTYVNFREIKEKPELLIGDKFDEKAMLLKYEKAKDDTTTLNLYLNKLILAYYFERFDEALEIIKLGRKKLKSVAGLLLYALFVFYETLVLFAVYKNLQKRKKIQALNRIRANQKKIDKWTKFASPNFINKATLLSAEWERIHDNYMEASSLYDLSANLAQEQEFTHEEALAYELAAKCWLQAGKEEFAGIYLNKAHKHYEIWGAYAKARIIRKKHENLIIRYNYLTSTQSFSQVTSGSNSLLSLSIDLETVLDASKAISGEVVFSKLLKKTMSIILEHAGAEKGVLALKNDLKEKLVVEARGKITNNTTEIIIANDNLSDVDLPVSLLHYVERTSQMVILHNACNEGNFTHNPYIAENLVKSVLAIPILRQSKILGILYLENNLSTRVFTPERVNILSILCTQIAISIENARMFATLEKKVAKRTSEIQLKNKILEQQNEEIEKARDELKKSNATKDKFFSIIAHDLRGPVGNILSFLTLVSTKQNQFSKEQIFNYLKNLRNTTEKTYNLLNNLLIWAKTQQHEIEFNPKKHDLKEVITNILDIYQTEADLKNIHLIFKMEKELSAVFDVDMINTVIRNLINNALKYTPAKGTITVSVKGENKHAVISVADTGIGMNAGQVKNIFNLDYKRASQNGINGETGTGLGLVLCKEFVEKHNGKIWAESTPKKGTSIIFTLYS